MLAVVCSSVEISCRVVLQCCAVAAASGMELLAAPLLAYKKWSLTEQQQVTDHTPCGVSFAVSCSSCSFSSSVFFPFVCSPLCNDCL